MKLRNRNTLGFGEQTEILGVASEAETAVGARILSDRLISTFVGYDVALRSVAERPRFFVDGEDVNRAHFLRNDARFALQRGIDRSWAFEGALRLGTVRTYEEAGLDFPTGKDEVRTIEVGGVVDALDDRQYPTRHLRWRPRATGASPGSGLPTSTGRRSSRRARRSPEETGSPCSSTASPASPATHCPPTSSSGWAGPVLLPGYHINELWGAQALAGLPHIPLSRDQEPSGAGPRGHGERLGGARGHLASTRSPSASGWASTIPPASGPSTANAGVRRGGDMLFTFSIGYP